MDNHQPICNICNSTGWILPSNEKIRVEVLPVYGKRIELPESEQMIKCSCIKPKDNEQ